MTRSEIEEKTSEIFRQIAMRPGKGAIDMSRPLGDLGYGLDSLALVEFMAAVEKSFGVELPESIWMNGRAMTPGDVVELIAKQSPLELHHAPTERSTRLMRSVTNLPRTDRIRQEISDRGLAGTAEWIFGQVISQGARMFYSTLIDIIYVHDLCDIPSIGRFAKIPLEFRNATVSDSVHFKEFWAPHLHDGMIRKFEQRMGNGVTCLMAWHESELVGVDYLSEHGDYESDTGLTIRMGNGSCYAFDLHEKYQGQGIGLSLIAYSFAEVKRRGLRQQVTLVRTDNTRMISAATQLAGYKEIGKIFTRRILGRPSSVWTINGEQHRGKTIVL